MSDKEHRTVSVDTREHCPALRGRLNLPGPDLQYEITLDPDHQAQEGATCPWGDGYAMLQLEDAYDRVTPNGRIRAIVMCAGCTHLRGGFETEEIRLKPTVRT